MFSWPLEYWLILGTFVPLFMFGVLTFLGYRLGKPGASVPAILGILISTLCSAWVLYKWWFVFGYAEREHAAQNTLNLHWATLGDIDIMAGVKLDSLTVCVFFMVTVVSSCIFIFSRGYMSGRSDEVDSVSKYHRFFTFLSLFAFSMLGLVISSSLVFLFIFWELVGVCSYFLIGFYFDKKFASDAGIKAFIVNRVGDFGFIVGLAMVVTFLGDVSLDGAASQFARQFADHTGLFASTINLFGLSISGYTIATIMGICLFCGCIGKSAQFPLQVWLPDAMAGPTPVSALIHAATMVAAGVYLVARIFPLLTPEAQLVIAVIGCITLTIAALVAIVQVDIKKVLAYSTLSQLGYMVFGMGCGAWIAALFHLITHAFFKALLFLCSGQVIEGCHHEQDIRKMGGLYKKMPITCWTFFIGVLAISGVGLPALMGIPKFGVGGYYSKDEILAVAYYRSHPVSRDVDHTIDDHGSAKNGLVIPKLTSARVEARGSLDDSARVEARSFLPKWLFWLPVFIAYITPFYMMRVWWLTFMGKPRDKHVHEHAHEIPWMKWPLAALAVGTFLSSWFLFRDLIADAAKVNWAGSPGQAAMISPVDGLSETVHHAAHHPLTYAVWPAFLVGFFVAWLIYRKGINTAFLLSRKPGLRVLYDILVHKFYFDEFYNTVVHSGTKLLARISGGADKWILDFGIIESFARVVKRMAFFSGDTLDTRGVDRVANGIGEGAFKIGDVFRFVQTGRIRNYVLFSATSVLVVLLALMFISK